MADKEYVKEFGATAATVLRLTKHIHGSGRIVIGDSWFGSLKALVALKHRGLFGIMLVKTNHVGYPKELLGQSSIPRGKWVGYKAEVDEIPVQAVRFTDLKKKDFVSTCSTAISGEPRVTKHCGKISRPQVAEYYLRYAAAIDIHNHIRTGSLGLEDVYRTSSPHKRQFGGIVGFLFTNAYLAYNYFNSNIKHSTFKKRLATAMLRFSSFEDHTPALRSLNNSVVEVQSPECVPVANGLDYGKPCYYCKHGFAESVRKCTTFNCAKCGVPLHRPTNKNFSLCWKLHLENGLPPKRKCNKKSTIRH